MKKAKLNIIMAFVVILISSSIAICEENNQPKTKLEEFSGKTGVVIVKGYTSFKPLTGVTGGGPH